MIYRRPSILRLTTWNGRTYGEGAVPATANITMKSLLRLGSVKFQRLTLGPKRHNISRRGKLDNDAMIDWAIGVMNEGNVVGTLIVTSMAG